MGKGQRVLEVPLGVPRTYCEKCYKQSEMSWEFSDMLRWGELGDKIRKIASCQICTGQLTALEQPHSAQRRSLVLTSKDWCLGTDCWEMVTISGVVYVIVFCWAVSSAYWLCVRLMRCATGHLLWARAAVISLLRHMLPRSEYNVCVTIAKVNWRCPGCHALTCHQEEVAGPLWRCLFNHEVSYSWNTQWVSPCRVGKNVIEYLFCCTSSECDCNTVQRRSRKSQQQRRRLQTLSAVQDSDAENSDNSKSTDSKSDDVNSWRIKAFDAKPKELGSTRTPRSSDYIDAEWQARCSLVLLNHSHVKSNITWTPSCPFPCRMSAGTTFLDTTKSIFWEWAFLQYMVMLNFEDRRQHTWRKFNSSIITYR